MINLRNHTCAVGNKWYRIKTLIDCTKDLPVKECSPEVFYLSLMVWDDLKSVADFNGHVARTLSADLSFPIILAPDGSILDGFHRIAKALLKKRSVKYVKLRELPEADWVKDEE